MRTALLCFLLLTVGQAHALTVAAASSLRQAMPALETAFNEEAPGIDLRVIYGASGKLATQILNGAPYDVFLSADTDYPQRLSEQGATAGGPVVYGLGRLVVWFSDPDADPMAPEDLADERINRIAIAQPRHAPYGQRAREVLQALDLWQVLEPKLVYGENIGQTAAMVESGAADAGLIAWSLTFAPEMKDRPFTLVDQHLHSPLAMAMVITRPGEATPGARDFFAFMQSDTAMAILRQYGFEHPDAD